MLRQLERMYKKIEKNGTSKFLAEIGWREFNHSLINYSHMLKNNYSKNLINFHGKKFQIFECLEKGLTGYPIVDAGMRELHSTGWMPIE